MQHYHRYTIETKKAPHIIEHPHRFRVKVDKLGLAKLLLKEFVQYGGKLDVVLSRPCVYGVFSGPLGGFAPREKLCVGCMRCQTEHPDFVQITRNSERSKLGDSYFTPDYVDTVVFEAETGHIPIKGQGYRGKFGGSGWDGMWTDMSEIVRPTRDGIHGREYISTEVDLGEKPPYLQFDDQKRLLNPLGSVSISIPFLFDTFPDSLLDNRKAWMAVIEAARHVQTYTVAPIEIIEKLALSSKHLIPLIKTELAPLTFEPLLIEMDGWNENLYREIKRQFPSAGVILRLPFDEKNLLTYFKAGVRIFHFAASYHGRNGEGAFILDKIRAVNQTLVDAKHREEVTLLGSGGIIAAEHMAKAILCGLDAAALDTALLVALQAKFNGDCVNRSESRFTWPEGLTAQWGEQRIKNLCGAWRDQLLEILGAMGLREVRRLRGEMGRALFQKDLEKEAFADIEGYGG